MTATSGQTVRSSRPARIAVVAVAAAGLAGCVVYERPAPYYAPAYSTTAVPAPAQQTCRDYRSDATIDGKMQQLHGTACLQPDGTWQYIR